MDLGKLLQDLKNLSTIVTKSGTLNSSFKAYDVKAYGPNELKAKLITSISQLFEVIEIGDDKVPYVVFNVRFPMKFSSIEEFIDQIVSMFDNLLENVCVIFTEPRKIIINLDEMYDPEVIGIPMGVTSRTAISNVDIMNSVFPNCSPRPAPGEIFRRQYLAELLRAFYLLRLI